MIPIDARTHECDQGVVHWTAASADVETAINRHAKRPRYIAGYDPFERRPLPPKGTVSGLIRI